MLYHYSNLHLYSLYVIYALLSRNQLCRDYARSGRHFLRKFGGGRHKNILKDRAKGAKDERAPRLLVVNN